MAIKSLKIKWKWFVWKLLFAPELKSLAGLKISKKILEEFCGFLEDVLQIIDLFELIA